MQILKMQTNINETQIPTGEEEHYVWVNIEQKSKKSTLEGDILYNFGSYNILKQ